MQLVSLEFALFFLVVLALAWSSRSRPPLFRLLVLGASYVFYAAFQVWFVPLLAATSLLSWGAGLGLARLEGVRQRKTLLTAYLGLVLGQLCLFKYALLASETFPGLPELSLILPVGISFFTFQGVGYVVDVYRDKEQAVRNPLDILLFMAFFPTLLSGPILRAREFVPQLHAAAPAWTDAQRAFWLILLGLFKKLALSSYLSEHVTRHLFTSPEQFSSFGALFGVAAYSAQIYLDFSGYSDLAQGLAGLLGLRVPDNFRQPYKARDLREFWAGWHISLSTWLRDYLYIPLGGNRAAPWRRNLNLMLTMGLGGFWHGANWTFLAWGALHGLGLMATHAARDKAGQDGDPHARNASPGQTAVAGAGQALESHAGQAAPSAGGRAARESLDGGGKAREASASAAISAGDATFETVGGAPGPGNGALKRQSRKERRKAKRAALRMAARQAGTDAAASGTRKAQAASAASRSDASPRQPSPWRLRLEDGLRWLGTFSFVSLAWVFFASPDFATAMGVLGRIADLDAPGRGTGLTAGLITVCVIGYQALRLDWLAQAPSWLTRLPLTVRAAALGVFGALIVRLGPDGMPPFIYFSF